MKSTDSIVIVFITQFHCLVDEQQHHKQELHTDRLYHICCCPQKLNVINKCCYYNFYSALTRYLWVLCDEHQWRKHTRLPQQDRLQPQQAD